MIKVTARQMEDGIVRLTFQSNSPEADQDQLDLIGAAVVNVEYSRRGGFSISTPGTLTIEARDTTFSTKTHTEV